MGAANEQFGHIDVLVNNAAVVARAHWGPAFRWPPVRDMDFDFWNSVIDTNLAGRGRMASGRLGEYSYDADRCD
jgi:NAD(P)-dependent dehydrogenase (short-subunit alcohol dehydrogenase family)